MNTERGEDRSTGSTETGEDTQTGPEELDGPDRGLSPSHGQADMDGQNDGSGGVCSRPHGAATDGKKKKKEERKEKIPDRVTLKKEIGLLSACTIIIGEATLDQFFISGELLKTTSPSGCRSQKLRTGVRINLQLSEEDF